MFTPIIESLKHPEIHLGHWSRLLYRPVPETNPVLVEHEHFRLKLAENAAEVEAAQRLRYRVFKEEQGRLGNCRDTIDRDRFDRHCRHLIVIEKENNRVVGTYRVLSGRAAAAAGGFYSEEEFDIRGLEKLRQEVYEVGRSCVAPEFRSGAVVGLLWSGLCALRRQPTPSRFRLARYARHFRPRQPDFHYFFGCVSLETTDPVAAMAIYEHLRQNHLVSTMLNASPRPGFELPETTEAEVAAYLAANEKQLIRTLPPLFKGYLKLGAKICGPPAFDREFGTIDFLILQDLREMPPRHAKHFAGQASNG